MKKRFFLIITILIRLVTNATVYVKSTPYIPESSNQGYYSIITNHKTLQLDTIRASTKDELNKKVQTYQKTNKERENSGMFVLFAILIVICMLGVFVTLNLEKEE